MGMKQGGTPPYLVWGGGLPSGGGPATLPKSGPIAQWLEQGTHNALVAGSNPAGPRTYRERRSLFLRGLLRQVGSLPDGQQVVTPLLPFFRIHAVDKEDALQMVKFVLDGSA